MKIRYLLDERRAIELLVSFGLTASEIYINLRLTRGAVKKALKSLQSNGRRHVALAGNLCATRFKHYTSKGESVTGRCTNGCGKEDSLRHLLKCYRLGPPYEGESSEKWVLFLKQMARKAAWNSPFIPIPMAAAPEEQGGISFEESEISSQKLASERTEHTLSFDGDDL